MIAGINESKPLTKHISCECKCKLDGRKYNPGQWWNNSKCWCEYKKILVFEKDYVWNSDACNCGNRKYLTSIVDDSVIICNEVIDADTKLCPKHDDETNFNEKKVTCKTQNFYILLAFLLISIALLIAVII